MNKKNELIPYEMTVYEKNAVIEIHKWKNPEVTWLSKTLDVVSLPFEKTGELFTKIPGVEWVLEKTVGGLVNILNDFAHWTVRTDAIYTEYRNDGYTNINSSKDIFTLDLEDADKVTGWLAAKYKTLAATEGAAAGYVGVAGIPADIVALIAMNQRAIGEYATYFGFDINTQQERLFALNILGLASSPDDAAKQVAMAQLVRIAQDVAKKRTWKELEQHTLVQVIKIIAKSLGVRLTKAKLAQVVPLTGAVVGSGFNAYYTNKVCEAAYYLYRERFLAEKYGEDVIDVTVKPASSYKPDMGYK